MMTYFHIFDAGDNNNYNGDGDGGGDDDDVVVHDYGVASNSVT
jgi:hypothetical protein